MVQFWIRSKARDEPDATVEAEAHAALLVAGCRWSFRQRLLEHASFRPAWLGGPQVRPLRQ